jgi:hypothetical protein
MRRGKTTGTSQQQSHYLKKPGLYLAVNLEQLQQRQHPGTQLIVKVNKMISPRLLGVPLLTNGQAQGSKFQRKFAEISRILVVAERKI